MCAKRSLQVDLQGWIYILGIKAEMSKFSFQTPVGLFHPFILWANGPSFVWFKLEGFHMNPREVQDCLLNISHRVSQEH